jgi:hypothetical protein
VAVVGGRADPHPGDIAGGGRPESAICRSRSGLRGRALAVQKALHVRQKGDEFLVMPFLEIFGIAEFVDDFPPRAACSRIFQQLPVFGDVYLPLWPHHPQRPQQHLAKMTDEWRGGGHVREVSAVRCAPWGSGAFMVFSWAAMIQGEIEFEHVDARFAKIPHWRSSVCCATSFARRSGASPRDPGDSRHLIFGGGRADVRVKTAGRRRDQIHRHRLGVAGIGRAQRLDARRYRVFQRRIQRAEIGAAGCCGVVRIRSGG